MLYGAIVLGDGQQVSLIPGGARIGPLREGMNEGQVVCLDGKRCPIEKMLKVMDGDVHCEKFSLKGGVPGLRRGELSAEEGDGLSGTMGDLFKDGADGDVTGISGKH